MGALGIGAEAAGPGGVAVIAATWALIGPAGAAWAEPAHHGTRPNATTSAANRPTPPRGRSDGRSVRAGVEEPAGPLRPARDGSSATGYGRILLS